jgi:hypothetical protein
MAGGTFPNDIHGLDPDRIGEQLRALGLELEPNSPPDDREIDHLVRVLTAGSLLLTDVYNEERIARIMYPEEGFLSQLVDRLLEDRERGEGEVLYRVRRLPDDVRLVGDKALFDLGVSQRRKVAGFDLGDLGRRAYRVAGELLERLSEDRLLREFFRRNRLLMLPLEEEVVFLQQCADRFPLHARLLQRLGESDPIADEPRLAASICVGGAEKQQPGEDTNYLEAALRGADDEWMTRDQLLAAYERMVRFSSLDHERLKNALEETVIDQQGAVRALCDEFSLFAAGTRDLRKPSSYFLVGPTGVGKNHLVETLTRTLEGIWESEIPMLALEGPNFTYPSDIHELRGATRGFIRSDEEGILTVFHETSSKAPFCVILVDEVEKAHPQLQRFFLSILDRGTVTDNRGQELNFANAMIFFTSNLGYSDRQKETTAIGYMDEEGRATEMDRDIRRELKRTLAPEFVNRVRMIHFNRLTHSGVEQILDIEFRRIAERYLSLHGIHVELSSAAREELIRRGFSPAFGARHLKKELEMVANVEVSRQIRSDDVSDGSDRRELLSWLQEIREGKRPFDREQTRERVREATRSEPGYRRLVIDWEDGSFRYLPMDEPEAEA